MVEARPAAWWRFTEGGGGATLIRLTGAIGAALVLATVVGAALLADAADVRERPIVADGRAGRFFAVDFESGDLTSHAFERTLRLFVHSPEALLRHDELRVIIATFSTSPHLDGAALDVVGSACVYRSAPGARLRNNEPLQLLRGARCDRLEGATGELRLTVQLSTPGRVGVWAFLPAEPGPADDGIQLGGARPAAGEARPLLHARYVEYLPETGLRRIDLLAYVWQIGGGTRWVWGLIACASVLFAVSLFALTAVPPAGGRGRAHARLAGGAGAAATALALLYTVVTPPFQGVDEPVHFLSYARLHAEPGFVERTAAWAALGHGERIRWRPAEQFRPSDIGAPLDRPWGEYVAFRWLEYRSLVATAAWNSARHVTAGWDPPAVFLTLRLLNVLLFGLAVGAGMLVFLTLTTTARPQMLAIGLLLVPSLPYFAMHVSEAAFQVFGYLLLASTAAAALAAGSRAHWAGLPFGLAAALVLAGGRSTLPMLPLVAGLLLARAACAPLADDHRTRRRHALVFWGGLLAPAALFWLTAGETYRSRMLDEIWTLFPSLTPQRLALLVPALLAAGAAGGLLAELGFARLRLRAGAGLVRCVPVLAGGLAIALAGIVAGSLVLSYPVLTDIEPVARVTRAEYLGEAAAGFVTLLRLAGHDWLLSETFWAGFGWLDTRPPAAVISVANLAAAAACVWLLAAIARRRDGARLVWVCLVGAAALATLLAYAWACYSLERNLHGRYLIGFYLVVLAVFWTGPAGLRPLTESRAAHGASGVGIVTTGLIVAAAAIHAVCLATIVTRYF